MFYSGERDKTVHVVCRASTANPSIMETSVNEEESERPSSVHRTAMIELTQVSLHHGLRPILGEREKQSAHAPILIAPPDTTITARTFMSASRLKATKEVCNTVAFGLWFKGCKSFHIINNFV